MGGIMDIDKAVEEIILAAQKQTHYYDNGKVGTGNKYANKLFALSNELKQNLNDSHKVIDALIDNDHINVVLWICQLALDVDYRKRYAVKALRKINKTAPKWQDSHNAYMTLITHGIKADPLSMKKDPLFERYRNTNKKQTQ